MKPIPIPTTVIIKVQEYVTSNFPTLTVKQKNSLYSTLLEIWFFIKEKHTHDVLMLESSEEALKNSGLAHLNYTNIHKKQLQSFQVRIGKSTITYKQLIDILIETQLIEKNDKYSVGKFSQSYRPHNSIAYETLEMVELNLGKIFKNAKSQTEIYAENSHKYRKLIDDLYLVNIDLEKLYWHLDQTIGLPYSNKTEAVLSPAKSYSLKIQALKINLGIHFFSVSSTGRIYSSIANLPTVMLPFLKLNGESVVELDAVNSQPLLLASMINHPQFKDDVEAGLFYEKMAESMGISRQEFKMKSYRWIFFSNNQIGSVWKKNLESVYPGLADMINSIKAEQPLWFALQSAEANIWIKVAQQQLFPVLTRHDSMVIKAENLETVKKQIIKEYKKIGLNVSLK